VAGKEMVEFIELLHVLPKNSTRNYLDMHVGRLNLSLSTPLPYTLPNDRAQQGFML
jgi:hypothetical protein